MPARTEIPAYRAFDTEVRAVAHLTPHFTRVTLHSPEFEHFHTGGLDQRIKLFLPRPDGTLPRVGFEEDLLSPASEWYTLWRELPDAERNPIRTYTVRAIRTGQREIDVDFVLHGDHGPASAWALSAAPGDRLLIIGPDGRSPHAGSGIEWKPGAAGQLLIAGDETAAPAICAILESLPHEATGHAYLEVPAADDVLEVESPSRVNVHWLPRDGAPLGSRLDPAVREWGRARATART